MSENCIFELKTQDKLSSLKRFKLSFDIRVDDVFCRLLLNKFLHKL